MPSLADLLTGRRQRKRDLLEELKPLQQDAATPEMQAAAYREALVRERAGAEAALARARSMPPGLRQHLAWEPVDVEAPTWGERVRRAERTLAGIDAELERVSQ